MLGGTNNVEITKEIIREAKFANQWYRAALEEQKKSHGEHEKRSGLKRKLMSEMKELTKKKMHS